MQWHQLDHVRTVCTWLQTDNHTNTSSLDFYRLKALPDAQPTVSKQPLYRSTCVSCHLQLRTGGFCWCKVFCLHALADGNQCIRIREKMLEFSSTVLSALSLYPLPLHLVHKQQMARVGYTVPPPLGDQGHATKLSSVCLTQRNQNRMISHDSILTDLPAADLA